MMGQMEDKRVTRLVIIITAQVRSLYTHKAEPATIKNLKRGVASMLMMQLKSGKMMEVKAVPYCALLTIPYTRFVFTASYSYIMSSVGVSSTAHSVHCTLLKCTIFALTCCGALDDFQ